MRLRKKVDNLEALVLDRFNAIEDGLKRVIARGEIVLILRDELQIMREERKELLDRLMARDFETLQTYASGWQAEKVGEEIKPEEDIDNAGEILEVTD
jgi:Zn-finger domain-containing protein